MPHNGECVLGWNFAIMTVEPATFALAETIRVEECHTLDQFIRSAGDRPIILDGQQVKKFGGQAAQLIAAHQNMRRDTETRIAISNPSDALTSALATLGLSHLQDKDRETA
jgi:anti-anti-sigma regulatory factor